MWFQLQVVFEKSLMENNGEGYVQMKHVQKNHKEEDIALDIWVKKAMHYALLLVHHHIFQGNIWITLKK